jgi:hypothetical protein
MTTSVEQILDACIEQMQAGEALEDVLSQHPEHAEELRPLLGLTDELAALPDPEPSLNGLMRAMTEHVTSETAVSRRVARQRVTIFARPVLLRLAASITIIFMLGWGAAAASSGAVPGDLMYPVKRFSEKVRLLITINEKDEAELRITFSERRLSEALKKHQQGGGIDDGLLVQMLDEAKQALDQALELPAEERSYLLSRVGYLTAHQNNVIETVKQSASPAEQKALEPVSDMCGRRMRWMGQRMKDARMSPPSCSGCWGSTSETSSDDVGAKTDHPDGRSDEAPATMRQWMQGCPTWGECR